MVFANKPSLGGNSGGGGGTVTGKRYNPYTGKWEDVYGNPGSAEDKSNIKKGGNKPKSTTPPTTSDVGNDHRGSGEDNQEENINIVRAIEYDLEGTLEIRPIVDLESRKVINLQGLGVNFSGNYFLNSVIHTINRSGYTQSLEVLRSNFEWKTGKTKKTELPKKQPKKQPAKRYHTVVRGDTLWGISRRYYGNGALYMRIVNANKSKIKDPHWIYPKQVFLIP